MKNYQRSFVLALSLVGLAATGSSYAEDQSPMNCVQELKFQHTGSAHEQVSCIAPAGATVELSNWGELVTGFNESGEFSRNADVVNKFHLDAYHDPDYKYIGRHGTICVKTPGVVCYLGKRAPEETQDRPKLDEPYGY